MFYLCNICIAQKQCIMLNNNRVRFICIEMNTKNIEQSLEISIYLIENTHKTIRKRFKKKNQLRMLFIPFPLMIYIYFFLFIASIHIIYKFNKYKF